MTCDMYLDQFTQSEIENESMLRKFYRLLRQFSLADEEVCHDL